MFDPDQGNPYSINEIDGQFQVIDWEENVVLICNNAASAEHYAALIKQAFLRGYKQGLRKGKML